MNIIRILHSFPEKEAKFNEYCRLTFGIDKFENTYVSNLNEIDDVNKYDVIIIHFLRYIDCKFLIKYEVEIPVIWFCWGGDVFNDGKFHKFFLQTKTRRLRRKLSFKKGYVRGFKQVIKDIIPLINEYSNSRRIKINSLSKIDYMVPVMPGDFSIIKKHYAVNFQMYHLNYVNPLIEKEIFEGITGKNILLGNSASFSNNHIEAINYLSNIDLDERKIIIPLSYGNTDLSSYIEKYAKNKFGGERVIILKDFIPLNDYNKILNSCEIVVMNHIRQQAVGNIVQSLLNGAHLYLREESTVYKFLHENGFKVSSFNYSYQFRGLNNEEILNNRIKTKLIFGLNTQHIKILALIEKALN